MFNKIFYFFIFLFVSNSVIFCSEKTIKLYGFCTPSHQILKEQFFLPSIKDDFDVVIEDINEQICPTGVFQSQNWNLAVKNKAALIIRSIKENWGGYFIYADMDIQFIQPINSYIAKHFSHDLDLLAQWGSKKNEVCTGFMVIRANSKSLEIWQDVEHLLNNNCFKGDQNAFNFLLRSNNYEINYAILPKTFYSPWRMWMPGENLYIPENIMLHHANWTKGVENKIKQLEYVKKMVMNKKSIP